MRGIRMKLSGTKWLVWLPIAAAMVMLSAIACGGSETQVAADFPDPVETFDENDRAAINRLFLSVLRFQEQGDFASSIEVLNDLLRRDPGNPEALYQRGNANRTLGQLEDAIGDYTAALRSDPELVEAYLRRGVSHANLGRFEEAILDFDQVILLDGPDATMLRNRGLAYYELDRWQEAIEDLDVAIELDPTMSVAFNDRGLSYVKLGQYKRAIEDFDQAVE